MNNLKSTFRVGDCVRVRAGVQDPDWGADLGGWQGRITELRKDEHGQALVSIQWDSLTLQNMPAWMIEKSEEEGLGWTRKTRWSS